LDVAGFQARRRFLRRGFLRLKPNEGGTQNAPVNADFIRSNFADRTYFSEFADSGAEILKDVKVS